MSDLSEQLRQLSDRLPLIVADALQRFPFVMSAYINEEMDFRSASTGSIPVAPSGSDRLALGTGALARSFLPNKPGNIFNVVAGSSGVRVDYGSDLIYAGVHEYGGFVASKGKMHKFFWAKYYETKSVYYKNLALGVKRKGGINIKARPFFAPALARFEREGLDKIYALVIAAVQKEFSEL